MAKDFSRTDRVAEQLQRELAQLIQMEVKDPRIRMVTITGVEVTRDYAHANVYYTTLEGESRKLQEGLEKSAGFLRSRLGASIKLRVTPQLHFIFDSSIERGSHLSQLIDKAIAEDNSRKE
jgi:ribosome-binding factor A